MISQMRKSFIKITMFSSALVLILLIATINIVNYVTVNNELNQTLYSISERQMQNGIKPESGQGEKKQNGHQSADNNRYFTIVTNSDGTIDEVCLDRISAVTTENLDEYQQVVNDNDSGFGNYSIYRYYITATDNGGKMATFLDCESKTQAVTFFAFVSVVAMVVCIGLIYVLVLFLSGIVIKPIIKNAERQKQFITNAGHELKTPLTVIATSLQVLEMDVGEHKWIDKAQTQTEKLGGLVDELILMSKMNESATSIKMSPFDICTAVSEIANSFKDVAQAKGRELVVNIPKDFSYFGDEYSIRKLISILLDNALKYSSGDGKIECSLYNDSKGIRLVVSNPYDKNDITDTNRLFERFYRADESRSTQKSSFGIGLSMASDIADIHKGSIKAVIENNVITFTVKLKNMNKKA